MSCLIASFAMNCDALIKSMRGGHELPAETMEKLMRSIMSGQLPDQTIAELLLAPAR